jgi:hypothetical protein
MRTLMTLRTLCVLPLLLAVAGCASSARFDSVMGTSQPRAVAQPAPALAAPTGPVSSEPLAPVAPGTGPTVIAGAVGTSPGQDPSVIDPTGSDPLLTPMPDPTTTPEVPATEPPKPASAAGRSVAGSWKISDAGRGTSCSIMLTQSSLLDLYRAKPQGCQASSLAKVNAWQQRGQEIVLIEPGGRTAVRLFPKGDGTFEGAATTSGAVVSMTR